MIAVHLAAMVLGMLKDGAPAQASTSQAPALATPAQPISDDIVVTALRDIEAKDSAVTAQTLGSARTGSAVGSRATFERSQRWAACAINTDADRYELLRNVIDGRTNSAAQGFGLQRLAQINATCAPDVERARAGLVTNPYYDRGSLTVAVLKTFVPHLRLTKAQTGDPAVQARFNAREVRRAGFRLPVDRQYFETAVCFVRLQPELSVRLAMTDKPLSAVRRLEAAIVNRSKVCVGNARRVYFDGVQFRFYIADAVYRWALAASDRATLIPD